MSRTPATGFLDRRIRVGSAEHRYQVYVPPAWQPGSAWPVILFLHGSGERGEDGILQTDVGLGASLRRHRERWPAVVVFPQVRTGDAWRGEMLEVARAALDASLGEFHGDEARVSLTGISMGGYGVWRLALEEPERFSALAPICGGLDVPGRGRPVRAVEGPGGGTHAGHAGAHDAHAAAAAALKRIPVWIFHGEADAVIHVSESRRMAEALSDAGAAVRFTEYPGVGHDSWSRAYAEPELPRWLLELRRPTA